MQVEPKRFGSLHPVEIDDLVAGQSGHVATFAEFVDEVAQHRMPCAVLRGVEKEILGKLPQPGSGAVVAAVGLPDEQARALELLKHAVQGRFGQRGLLD